MNILMFAGSLRKDSLNKRLIRVAARLLDQEMKTESFEGLKIHLHELNEFEMPVYDADIEAKAIPDSVLKLAEKIRSCQAVILSCPEYNGGVAGPVKNMIDWISRARPMPWEGKPILLMAASPGGLGGMRGAMHTRVPLDVLHCYVYPEFFCVAAAHQAFDSSGEFKDAAQRARLQKCLDGFIPFARQFFKT